jgi:anti-sigma B factor antagonist
VTEAAVTAGEVWEGARTVELAGEVDLINAAEVERRLLALAPNHLTRLTLDLGGLTYLDSAGLRVLFVLATRLEVAQIELELVVPARSPVRRAIEVAGMGALVEMVTAPGQGAAPAVASEG